MAVNKDGNILCSLNWISTQWQPTPTLQIRNMYDSSGPLVNFVHKWRETTN